MTIFKSKQKKFEGDLKIKLCSRRLYPTESFKYLGVNSQNSHLFKQSSILKFQDKICLENILFVRKSF